MICVFKYLMKYEKDYEKVPLKQREKIKRSRSRALQLTAQIMTDTTTITHAHTFGNGYTRMQSLRNGYCCDSYINIP